MSTPPSTMMPAMNIPAVAAPPPSLRDACQPVVEFLPADDATSAMENDCIFVSANGARVTIADMRRIASAARREDRLRVTRDVFLQSAEALSESVKPWTGQTLEQFTAMMQRLLDSRMSTIHAAFARVESASMALGLTKAASDVLAERQRQVAMGYGAPHDEDHDAGEIESAVAAYAWAASGWPQNATTPPGSWPWDASDWKPRNPRRALVKAAALALAAIERHDYLAALCQPLETGDA